MQKDNASTNDACRKLVEDYRQEVERLKHTPDKHGTVRLQLSFIVKTLRQLCEDPDFVDLLHAEGLDSMPRHLAELIWPSAGNPA
jgi:ParB family chromosome partitioning protein